mmetsp:Transcript_59783/g.146803  ORF Transcript_59783/g.146803 Transcript_59783/m.146803 type:complete len:250 (-) Transcript_59783:338-1087(-)
MSVAVSTAAVCIFPGIEMISSFVSCAFAAAAFWMLLGIALISSVVSLTLFFADETAASTALSTPAAIALPVPTVPRPRTLRATPPAAPSDRPAMNPNADTETAPMIGGTNGETYRSMSGFCASIIPPNAAPTNIPPIPAATASFSSSGVRVLFGGLFDGGFGTPDEVDTDDFSGERVALGVGGFGEFVTFSSSTIIRRRPSSSCPKPSSFSSFSGGVGVLGDFLSSSFVLLNIAVLVGLATVFDSGEWS